MSKHAVCVLKRGHCAEGHEQASHATYYGLVGLQHRGQEGAGMVVGDIALDHTTPTMDFEGHKGMGLVHNVFSKEDLDALPGNCAVGHTRYSTSGGKKAIAGIACTLESMLAVSHAPLNAVWEGNSRHAYQPLRQ
jgi:glutamine phosphoribosylpyrophosphate amidotransferase